MSPPVVLVTGGARRIGAEICRRFHKAGFNVLIHCRASRQEAEKLEALLNADRPESARVLPFNVEDAKEIAAFCQQCLETFGQLDVLVNNANLFAPTPLNSINAEQITRQMSINLAPAILLSKELAPHLKSIVNISDVHAIRPLADYLVYAATQAALDMVTRSLALELAPDIRVNGIAPGAILWPESTAEMSEQERESMLSNIPLGRLGSPADIAALALFLGHSATYMTGQTISVAGGMNRH